MAIKYANNATSTLSATITSTTTSFSVASGEGSKFPVLGAGDYFYVTLVAGSGAFEIVKVTGRSTDTFTVVRGQDGTTGTSFAAGAKVELRVTKALIDDIRSWGATPQTSGLLLGKTDTAVYSPPQILDYPGYIGIDGHTLYPGTVGITIDGSGSTNIAGNGYYSAGVYSIRQAIINNTIQVGQNLKLVVEIPTPGNDEIGTGVFDLIDMGTITALYQSEEYFVSYVTIVCTNPTGFNGTGATWRPPYHIYGFYVHKFVIGGTVGENVFLGNQAGVGVTTGGENVAIGAGAGSNIGTGRNNVVIGNAATASAAGVDNEVTLGNSSHTKTRLFGALAVGGSSYGNYGDVLTSQGSTTAPIWAPAGSGLPSQTGNAYKFLVTDGSTASWSATLLKDLGVAGQGRFSGWHQGNAGSGLATEIGAASGQGWIQALDRDLNTYAPLNLIGGTYTRMTLDDNGVNVSQGALKQGGYQVLHAGNYTSYVSTSGSSSITTVGTLTAGTWNAGVIGSAYGGTGVNNAGRTLTVNTNSGALTFSNASTTLTVANTASVSGTNTGDQTITLTGDATGTGTGSFAVTLANSGATAGTYTKVTVDAKGRVTAGSSLASADLPTYTGTLTSSQVTTALTFTPISSSGNTSGYSGSVSSNDLRTISPSSHAASRVTFGFTSWANNNTANYADYIHFRSYSDSSGGSDNLVTFLKSGIGMRIWQQSFGSATAYSSYVDVVTSGNYTNYVGNGTFTVTAGTGLSGGGTLGTANQTGNSSVTLSLGASGVAAGSYTNTNITVDQYGRITAASNGSSGAGAGTYLPLTGGALTGTISIATSGSASSTSHVIIKRSGQAPSNFGSYSGSWRSSVEIWNNDSTRMLFLNSSETDYGYANIKSVGGGINVGVGSSGGTTAMQMETSGATSFPVSLQATKLSVGSGTTDQTFGVSGVSHIANYIYMDLTGTLGNYNSWSSRIYSTGGTFYVNTNYFEVNRYGYGATSPALLYASSSGLSIIGNTALHAGNYTSYAPSFLGGYNNSSNPYVKASATGAMGLLGIDSGGSFKWQIYGDGSNYGFLNGTWAGWDLRKAIGGDLYINGNVAVHAGNVGSYVTSGLTVQTRRRGSTWANGAIALGRNLGAYTVSNCGALSYGNCDSYFTADNSNVFDMYYYQRNCYDCNCNCDCSNCCC